MIIAESGVISFIIYQHTLLVLIRIVMTSDKFRLFVLVGHIVHKIQHTLAILIPPLGGYSIWHSDGQLSF